MQGIFRSLDVQQGDDMYLFPFPQCYTTQQYHMKELVWWNEIGDETIVIREFAIKIGVNKNETLKIDR